MIISDSTTLIILFDLDRIALLSNLFSKIVIPNAVYQEVCSKKSIVLPEFMTIRQVQDNELLATLKLVLDLGESEAIAMAIETQSKLIIDEKKERKIATAQGIEIIGLLGIIYLNVKKDYLSISQAKQFIEEAIKHHYRISQKLVNELFAKLKNTNLGTGIK